MSVSDGNKSFRSFLKFTKFWTKGASFSESKQFETLFVFFVCIKGQRNKRLRVTSLSGFVFSLNTFH